VQFFKVSEGLQNEEVNAAFHQCFDLFAKGISCFLVRVLPRGSIRIPSGPTEPATHRSKALGSFSRQAGACQIDIAGTIGQTVAGESEAVAAERGWSRQFPRRLEGTRGGYFESDRAATGLARRNNDLRKCLGVEKGAHSAVTKHRGGFQMGKQVRRHSD